jgi:hypothetical protein
MLEAAAIGSGLTAVCTVPGRLVRWGAGTATNLFHVDTAGNVRINEHTALIGMLG